MGEAEIVELERLANQRELVSPIEYENEGKDEQIFYEFVRQYGESLGIEVLERKIGFLEDRKLLFNNLRAAITNSEIDLLERVLVGLNSFLELALTPLFYPLDGGTGIIIRDDDPVTVGLPAFRGISGLISPKSNDYGVHEYMHVYHLLVAKDLNQRNLLTIGGYKDVGYIEPPMPPMGAPRQFELKMFEKSVLDLMIAKERKVMQDSNSSYD